MGMSPYAPEALSYTLETVDKLEWVTLSAETQAYAPWRLLLSWQARKFPNKGFFTTGLEQGFLERQKQREERAEVLRFAADFLMLIDELPVTQPIPDPLTGDIVQIND